MRFKVDENLPVEAVESGRLGHDAMSIYDQEMVGSSDLQAASVCKSEQRALITLDLDCVDIRTCPPADHPGIIVLRPRVLAKPTIIALLDQVLPRTFSLFNGASVWTVVDCSGVGSTSQGMTLRKDSKSAGRIQGHIEKVWCA